jgi:uncharacterized protein (UPF0332 family)
MDARTVRIRQLMTLAEQALNTAQVNLDVGDFRATVNRAYYAIFYAASAMLLTKGLERRKHSGVISAFREHFVKPGLVEAEYSNVYGETLVIREDADYAVEILIDLDMSKTALRQARRFVGRMHEYLVEEDFGDEPSE